MFAYPISGVTQRKPNIEDKETSQPLLVHKITQAPRIVECPQSSSTAKSTWLHACVTRPGVVSTLNPVPSRLNRNGKSLRLGEPPQVVLANHSYSHEHNKKNANIQKIYSSMIGKGRVWQGLDKCMGEKSVDQLSLKNVNTAYPLSKLEQQFLALFCKQDFYLSHFSNSDFRNEDGSVDILSRDKMVERGKFFDENNTERLDIECFATTGFSFMGLECGNTGKKYSRFGNYVYKVKFSDIDKKTMSRAFCQACDFGRFDERPIDNIPDFLSGKVDYDAFFEGDNLKERRPQSLVFKGNEVIKGLGLCIIKDSRYLTDKSKNNILLARTPDEFNAILNSFFRPQMLFPISIHIPSDKLIYSKPRDVPHFYV
ncbi:hypothetical protein ACS86_13110 [Vibrio alginolyticus]|nr:hypothetical protein ACS86_13110 [Vibrio alginolyticus]